MELTHEILDIAAYEAQKLQPATIVARKSPERWLVRALPLGMEANGTEEWSMTLEGDWVRIPLYPYFCNGVSPSVAMAYAVQMGLVARDMVDKHYEVLRTHVAVGDPVQETEVDNTPVLRFWFGFGFVVKERK